MKPIQILPIVGAAVLLSVPPAFAEDAASPAPKPSALAKTGQAFKAMGGGVLKLVKKPVRLFCTAGKNGSAIGVVIFAVLEHKLAD